MKFLFTERETRKDRYFLYNYNGQNFRLVKIKSCKLPGFEQINKDSDYDVNSIESIRASLSRTKRNIRELALSNNFEYFCTITINSLKSDRYNLDVVQKNLKKILKKIKRKNSDFAYLIITEKHKDGAFHFHGLIKGITDLYENEHHYLSSQIFSHELGYNSFSPIKSYEKCCNYITKYITKDCIKNTHNQVYISSRGLKKADKTEILPLNFKPTYSNDYISLLDFDITKLTQDDLLNFMKIEQI